MQDYDEKRISRRVPVDCRVEFTVQGAHEQHEGICRDLSVDGVAFQCEFQLSTGMILQLNVLPPSGSGIRPLSALVEVVRAIAAADGVGYEVAGRIVEVLG